MKRTWKRISLFLLAAVLLAGCGTGKPAEDADTTGSAADRSLPVTALASYSIVYAEEGLNEALYRELQTLRNTLRERFGATLPVRNDFVRENDSAHAVGEYEILVGETNRPESRAVCAELHRDRDYIIRLCGKKVVLAGLSHESVLAAVRAFSGLLPPAGAKSFFLPEAERFVKGDYAVSEASLNGTDLGAYTLIYENRPACRTVHPDRLHRCPSGEPACIALLLCRRSGRGCASVRERYPAALPCGEPSAGGTEDGGGKCGIGRAGRSGFLRGYLHPVHEL